MVLILLGGNFLALLIDLVMSFVAKEAIRKRKFDLRFARTVKVVKINSQFSRVLGHLVCHSLASFCTGQAKMKAV